MTMRKDNPEVIRLRYLYRRLIVEGRISLSHSAASRLIGPDTAYHLYKNFGKTRGVKGKRRNKC